MSTLRDRFIDRVHVGGYTCKLAAPKVVVEDVPSFGNYEVSDNTLHTSAWELLKPGGRAYFVQLAGPHADEAAAHALFETAAHRWIFIHEMGHWWQACNGITAEDHSPYRVEYDANRIALAYWREVNPAVVQTIMPIFRQVVDHEPSPLPVGQSTETYFNANYASLGPSPAYPWFMSRMNLDAYTELPEPSVGAVLAAAAR